MALGHDGLPSKDNAVDGKENTKGAAEEEEASVETAFDDDGAMVTARAFGLAPSSSTSFLAMSAAFRACCVDEASRTESEGAA